MLTEHILSMYWKNFQIHIYFSFAQEDLGNPFFFQCSSVIMVFNIKTGSKSFLANILLGNHKMLPPLKTAIIS